MRSFIVFGLSLLISILGCNKAREAVTSDVVSVSAENPSDWVVSQFEVKRITAKVTNLGKQAIDVKAVKASCGCRRPDLNPSRISAGQSANLSIEVGGAARESGQESIPITLITSSGEIAVPSAFVLNHSGKSISSPSILNFGRLVVGKGASTTIWFTPDFVVDWQASSFSCSEPRITLKKIANNVETVHLAKSSLGVCVTIDAAEATAIIDSKIECQLKEAEGKIHKYRIPLYAEIVSSVSVSPAMLVAGGISTVNGEQELKFILRSNDGKGVEFDRIESPQCLAVSVVESIKMAMGIQVTIKVGASGKLTEYMQPCMVICTRGEDVVQVPLKIIVVPSETSSHSNE